MDEKINVEIDGIRFKKSSYSASGGGKCVGVSIQNDYILVINTKTKDKTIKFTKEEWGAFISGVKEGEFDIL